MSSRQCITAVLMSLWTLCQAHLNQPQQAFGMQSGQMVQQVNHPAGAYGAAPHMGHPQLGGHVSQGGNMLRDKTQIQDREHIQEHLQEILGKYSLTLLFVNLHIIIPKYS